MSPIHPARSLDFLSRLHDDELSPSERAHFESHRAHCDECRRAASDFEQALASFRTTGTQPPPSDLAARILRRLEASNRRRSAFGVTFGIDLRWAGAFTAAIIAVILGYAVVGRRDEPRRIPISFATPAPSGSAAPEPGVRPTLLPPVEKPRSNAPLPSEARSVPDLSANSRSASPSRPAAAAKEKAEARSRESDEQSPKAEAAGGTDPVAAPGAKSLQQAAPAAPSFAKVSSRLTVEALDGEPAPRMLNADELPLASEDSGTYEVLVGADGVMREARLQDSDRKKTDDALAKAYVETLQKLRFEPGNRPRRLLIRVASP